MRSPASTRRIHRALLAGLLSQVASARSRASTSAPAARRCSSIPGSGQFKARPAWIVSAEQVRDDQGLRAQRGARRTAVDRAGRRAPGEAASLRSALGAARRRASPIYERTTLFGLTLSVRPQRPLRARRSEGRARAVHPARAGADGIRHARAVPRPQPEAARGDRVPAAEGAARRPAGRRGTALRVLRRARAGKGSRPARRSKRWRREAETQRPQTAVPDRAATSAGDRRRSMRERFPITCPPGPFVVQLGYRFDPGHDDDGVSALCRCTC